MKQIKFQIDEERIKIIFPKVSFGIDCDLSLPLLTKGVVCEEFPLGPVVSPLLAPGIVTSEVATDDGSWNAGTDQTTSLFFEYSSLRIPAEFTFQKS